MLLSNILFGETWVKQIGVSAGLHKEGSDAIYHYTKLELKDRFILMCQAFDEKPYSVKKDLSIFANKNA